MPENTAQLSPVLAWKTENAPNNSMVLLRTHLGQMFSLLPEEVYNRMSEQRDTLNSESVRIGVKLEKMRRDQNNCFSQKEF